MPRWFVRDSRGALAVCIAEHVAPDVAADIDEDELDITCDLSRKLRVENYPVRGAHEHIRAGSLLMLASPAELKSYATLTKAVVDDIVVASFPPPPRGRESTFMPGVRTFGGGESNEPSAVERAHAAGVCRGCTMDRSTDDIEEERLVDLGLYLYDCDEDDDGLMRRALVPTEPLDVARIGTLRTRCLRFDGSLATSREIALSDLRRPSQQ